MKKIFMGFGIMFVTLLLIGVTTIAEEITLTTYYPAPYGVYNDLSTGTLTTTGNTYLATTSGKVGIGTTSPNEKLEVEGKIRANNNFNYNGSDGISDTYEVVTDIQIVGINLQKKKRTVTVSGGIITDLGPESWENVGSVNP